MSTALTPEKVAEMLTGLDVTYDETLNCWVGIEGADGNVARILVEPTKQTSYGSKADTDNATHFRAVVVEGTEPPIVFGRATFEQQVNERFDNAIRKLGSESITFMPATVAALRQQILSLDVALADQGEAETR